MHCIEALRAPPPPDDQPDLTTGGRPVEEDRKDQHIIKHMPFDGSSTGMRL